ncbi:MAG: hypothetical protein ACPGJS_21385 [Flammeovirgaceae bacterium]
MDIKEIEKKIVELKAQQSDFFKKKKADRDAGAIEGIRSELNDLKAQVKEAYRGRQKEKRIAQSAKKTA